MAGRYILKLRFGGNYPVEAHKSHRTFAFLAPKISSSSFAVYFDKKRTIKS
jgi:hypothetical protein